MIQIVRTVAVNHAVSATDVQVHRRSTVQSIFNTRQAEKRFPAMPRQRLQARERRPKICKVTVQMTVTEVSEEKGWEDTKRREEFKKTESVVHRESDAARTLQRAYRGYKSRRELQGFSLDPSTRWTEVDAALSPLI